MKNNKGEAKGATFLWIAAALIALYLFVPSFHNWVGNLGGSTTAPAPITGITDSSSCPSSGITTETLNVQDALATTATNIATDYYVFNGMKLIQNGNTGSDGSASFDVACGKDYKVLLINESTGSGAGTAGAYGKIVDLKARISADTINEELTPIGGARIISMINPNYVDTTTGNTNMTLAAGQSKGFQIQFEANGTAKGYQNPIIACQTNVSSISSITLASFSDGTAVKSVATPSRVTASSGYTYTAWEYGKMLTTTQGSVTATGSVTASSTAPATADTIACIIVDQQMWKTSGWKTATSPEQAFLFGAQNTETNADVGGTDSSSASILIGAEAN